MNVLTLMLTILVVWAGVFLLVWAVIRLIEWSWVRFRPKRGRTEGSGP